MRIGTAVNTFSWNDMNSTAREYILMAKDVRDMQYRKEWPAPGDKTLIELIAKENKALKFYLDLTENKRSSSLILGLSADRKSTMQTRVSDRPLIRLDYSDNPEVLRHRNPDGSLIIGTHVHFDIDGYGAKWACCIPDQNILEPQDDDFASLFWSFQETCKITEKLKVELSLGV